MEEKIIFLSIIGPVKERLIIAYWKKQYVWVELRIPPGHRRENRSCFLAMAATQHLHGTHWIHFNPRIRSFSRLPALLNWQYHGTSKWLEDCRQYSIHSSGVKQPVSDYALRSMTRRPKLECFKSRKNLIDALKSIDNAIRA